MNRPPAPEIGVVVPTFNGARFLAPLLRDLTAREEVTEIVVVDDGSTDETPTVATRFAGAVTYLRQENRGVAAARNHGFRHVRAPVVAFLDVDDEWAALHPATGRVILREMDWEIVVGQTRCFTMSATPAAGTAFVPHGPPFHTFDLGSALIRRETFERVGGFDESLTFGEDLDWFLRAREAGVRMALYDRLALHYRLHGANSIGQSGFRRGRPVQRAPFVARQTARGRGVAGGSPPDRNRPSGKSGMNSAVPVSVIIPVFNGERFLSDAIRSVRGQDCDGVETIVIDDGSTDGSAAIARSFAGVAYQRQERLGAGAARNLGVELARGEGLAFLDADDLWLPGKLAWQIYRYFSTALAAVRSSMVTLTPTSTIATKVTSNARYPIL